MNDCARHQPPPRARIVRVGTVEQIHGGTLIEGWEIESDCSHATGYSLPELTRIAREAAPAGGLICEATRTRGHHG